MAAKKKRRTRKKNPSSATLALPPPEVQATPTGVYVRVPVSPQALDLIAQGRALVEQGGAWLERVAELVASERRRRR